MYTMKFVYIICTEHIYNTHTYIINPKLDVFHLTWKIRNLFIKKLKEKKNVFSCVFVQLRDCVRIKQIK